jgi:hypothetical protein
MASAVTRADGGAVRRAACPGHRRVFDFTTQHFHLPDRPGVTIFQTPESRSGTVTFHEAWGVDDGHSTLHCADESEAVEFIKRRYGVSVVLGPKEDA